MPSPAPKAEPLLRTSVIPAAGLGPRSLPGTPSVGLPTLRRRKGLLGHKFQGQGYDAGDQAGYLKAHVEKS